MNKGILFLIVSAFIGSLIILGLTVMIYKDNISNTESGYHQLYIPSGSTYQEVLAQIIDNGIVKNIHTFEWVAEKMNYPNTVEAGKYIIPTNSSNRQLVQQLRQGHGEVSVELILNNIASIPKLSASVAHVIEADSASINNILSDKTFLASKNLSIDQGWATILADTYQLHWDTDAKEFFNRMQREYQLFWNAERTQKASNLKLSPIEVIILASIIEKESNKRDEYPIIAGVYLNRLNQNWPLQADPTVKFALNQPNLKRILNIHLEVDSPYNTYKHPGLPPGPICLPEKTTINAVLEAQKHNYMFFCASPDFSGYHVFATTIREHNQNARKYQKFLNQSGIF